MFEGVKLAAAFSGGIICGLYDLKTSDMLDAVAWAMAALGILLHAYEGYVTGDWFVLIWCLTVVSIFLAFSLFMYYGGYWGGGDGQMLVAYGALLPFGTDGSLLFPFFLLLNVFLVGGLYSLLYCSVIIFRDKGLFHSLRDELRGCKWYFLGFAGALVLGAVHPVFIVLALLFLYPPALCFSRFVEENVIRRRIPVSTLKEGDALGEDVSEAGLKAKPVRGLSREEVDRIRKVRDHVIIVDGVRFIPVFPVALLLSLYFPPA